jgi:hypothetical protein
MAFDPNLDYEITDIIAGTIKTPIDTSKGILLALANVTLSVAETDDLNGIDEKRLPYVVKAVNDFGGSYPDLVSKRVSTVRADRLFRSMMALRTLTLELAEYQDRIKDISNNTEELLYRYLRDMYANAKQYRGDLPGADVVADELAVLFEEQGVQNPEPINP